MLTAYLEKFQHLNVNRRRDHESPHKPSMLLAIVGLAEAGLLSENEILFRPPLLDRYLEIFDVVRTDVDHPNPYFPFFHLQGDGFWHLQAKAGREAVVASMGSARSHAAIEENIDFARLDPELHGYLQDAESRDALRQTLIVRWFGPHRKQLLRLIDQDRYEKDLRDVVEHAVAEPAVELYEKATRDTAFRRVVTEAYDYRCAASGLRILLPGDLVMVQAAHLIPFAEVQDDDPRNGMALTPNFHWALDQHVIAPGPDCRWYVSKAVDARIADNGPLIQLEGQQLILPKDRRFWPRQDALEYRHSKLLDP